MENFEWAQLNRGKYVIKLVPSVPLDVFQIAAPRHLKGWNRVSVETNNKEQHLSGTSVTNDQGERYRFRRTRRGHFDQIFNFSPGENQIEITGLNLASVQIVIRRSSPLKLFKRVAISAIIDLFRLGIRRRNLRTVLQIISARDFKSFQSRLVQRYNQAPLASNVDAGKITPQVWMDRFMSLNSEDLLFIDDSIARRQFPSFSFVLINSGESKNEEKTTTLDQQLLPALETLVLEDFDPASSTHGGEWLVFIDADTEVHKAATFSLACHAELHPESLMIIPDSAEKSGDLFTKIRANPPWNLDLILGGEGVGPLLAIHNSVISGIVETGEDLSRTKNLTEIALTAYDYLGEKAISRLPLVLSATSKQSEQTLLDTTIMEYLREVDDEIFVSQGLCPQTRRIHWPIASQNPKVSILIPSKNRSDLLERCLNGIYESSDYSNFEVIVIDHQSNEEDALELLEKIDKRDDTRVLEFEGNFNFSLMNNIAAESSTGDFLCLLNNDIEVTSNDWIQELVSHTSREHVGVVGALLRYPDKSIQHAGLSPNLGSLYGHAHKYFPSGNFGYRNRLAVAHQVAAVTGACLMTSRELWGELGGLNQQLAVAYNDVDYCLRARMSGYQIIWTPFAELIHHESLSRGYDEHPKQRDRLAKESDLFISLWKDFLDDDPAYSPNLTLESTNFSLSDQPRFLPPWRKKF